MYRFDLRSAIVQSLKVPGRNPRLDILAHRLRGHDFADIGRGNIPAICVEIEAAYFVEANLQQFGIWRLQQHLFPLESVHAKTGTLGGFPLILARELKW